MNLPAHAKQIVGGVSAITEWLGSGGEVTDQQTAQSRADTCIGCPLNGNSGNVISNIADSIKAHLEFKNKIGLRVVGEKSIGTCDICGCALRLKIWLPEQRVRSEMEGEDRTKYPDYCWQLK